MFTIGLLNAIAQGFEPLTCCRIAGWVLALEAFELVPPQEIPLLTGAAKAMMVFSDLELGT